MNPKTHTCYKCGYTWQHGHHGGHSCSDRLKAELDRLKATIDEWQTVGDNIMQRIGELSPLSDSAVIGYLDACPQWHDAPTCAGLWVSVWSGPDNTHRITTQKELDYWARITNCRWFGPIPDDLPSSHAGVVSRMG